MAARWVRGRNIRARRRRLVFIIVCVFVLAGAGAGAAYYLKEQHKNCDFSSSVRQTVTLTLYCPSNAGLPSGVTSDVAGATMSDGTVLYEVKDRDITLAVSLQKEPSRDELANFIQNLIPLHVDTQTAIGKAQTGIANNRSLTSLPTVTNTWVLITGPADYDQNRLTQILKSFQAD